MQFSNDQISRLREVLSIPDFMEAWLDRFYSDEEISLVLLVAEKPLKIDEIAANWSGAEHDRQPNQLQNFLDRSCRRGIVGRCEDGRFQPVDFHERFDNWALFEGWKDLPDEVRSKLNAWELADYCRGHADQVQTLKNGGSRDPSLTWPEYVLLPEAEALIDKADHILPVALQLSHDDGALPPGFVYLHPVYQSPQCRLGNFQIPRQANR